jgi:hypothetical protein
MCSHQLHAEKKSGGRYNASFSPYPFYHPEHQQRAAKVHAVVLRGCARKAVTFSYGAPYGHLDIWQTQNGHALLLQKEEMQSDINTVVPAGIKHMPTPVTFQRKSAVNLQVAGSVGNRPPNSVERSSPGQYSLRL